MNEVRCPRNLSHLRSAPRSQATWYRHLGDPRSSDRDRVVLIVTSVGIVHYVVWTHSWDVRSGCNMRPKGDFADTVAVEPLTSSSPAYLH